MVTKNAPIEKSEQKILNTSFDKDFGVSVTEGLGYDGVDLQRNLAGSLATKVTVSGSSTYVGIAKPGTAQATAKWQCFKVDTSDGVVVTYADGNPNFDNVATDLTSLTYS